MQLIPSAELSIKFNKELIYPIKLEDEYLSDDIISLFTEWIKKKNINFDLQKVPVIPIGRVGPSLVFGHYQKEALRSSDWSINLFQHVLIPEKQYLEIGNHLKSLSNDVHIAQDKNNQIPWDSITINTKEEYLDLILNDLIIEDSLKPHLASFKNRSHWGLLELPIGYNDYYLYLKEKVPIVPVHLAEVNNECFELIPKNLQERYQAICFNKFESTMYVATADQNIELEDLIIAKSMGSIKEVILCLCSEAIIIEKRQDFIKGKKKESTQFLEVLKNKTQEEAKGNLNLDIKLIESVNIQNGDNSPEVIFQWLLYEAINRDVTDIHIEYCNERGRVRFRMDGDLINFYESSQEFARALVTVCKNICSMSSNIYDNQDAAFSVKYDNQKINLRVNAIPFRKHFQKLALRILPKKNSLTTLDKLGLASDHLSILRRAIGRKQGLILITGPTGEGKTTTLYAALSEINTPNINIQTVEDPIEREIEGINQTAVDLPRGITFQNIMRSIVRQDPNVILLGEIRDCESAELAIEAALTGHLVFSTLHANSAIKGIQRLIQLNVPHYLLADSLILLQAQRLIKRLCNKCKKQRDLNEAEKAIFSNQGVPVPPAIYDSKGCIYCGNYGYMGRIAIMEMIPINREISEMILNKENFLRIQDYIRGLNIRNLYQDALLKVGEGATSLDQAKIFEETWL